MSETPLLPCPFCGLPGQRLYGNGPECHIACACGALGPTDGEGNEGDEAGPAIAQWNRRALLELLPEEREALDVILAECGGPYLDNELRDAVYTVRALLQRTEAKP